MPEHVSRIQSLGAAGAEKPFSPFPRGYDGAVLASKTTLQPVVKYKDVDQRICRLLIGWGG